MSDKIVSARTRSFESSAPDSQDFMNQSSLQADGHSDSFINDHEAQFRPRSSRCDCLDRAKVPKKEALKPDLAQGIRDPPKKQLMIPKPWSQGAFPVSICAYGLILFCLGDGLLTLSSNRTPSNSIIP
ncbi:hypothetical protein RF11_07448 [Thelohanellus kitauei]|uniref:Uncharacterized protein n=1 Tax=Thelohanellus kitauei TaxID=669202 RepID=A0A0C2JDY9_THEKT|nr:hypothetical protein RF11_07448 [Thelohanellus kitauei]